MTTDNVYGAIERRLRDENFEVFHLFRDTREDWGDDGGYIVSVSKKDNKIYVHFLDVNYNIDVSIHCLENVDEDYNKEEDYLDYIFVKSIEEAQTIINEFVRLLDKCIKDDAEIYTVEDCDGYSYLKDLFYNYKHFISIMLSAYSEYSRDREKLLKLTSIPYVPDYNDPEEYMEG